MPDRYDTADNPEDEYYPGTSVLINLEDIRDPEELLERESELHPDRRHTMFGNRQTLILIAVLPLISLVLIKCSSNNSNVQSNQAGEVKPANATANTSRPGSRVTADEGVRPPDERPAHRWTCNDLTNSGAILGVTITDIDRSGQAVGKLKDLADASPSPVVTRIVFDAIEEDLSKESGRLKFQKRLDQYRDLTKDIHNVTCVMGEIGDSHELYKYLPRGSGPPPSRLTYEEWTRRLTTELGQYVDVWEIGNELNGGWTGWKCREDGTHCEYNGKSHNEKIAKQEQVLRATQSAYDTIQNLKGQHILRPETLLAVTLYYNNEGCAEYPEATLAMWLPVADRILSADLKEKVDYVLLSFYEKDCRDVDRTASGFYSTFGSIRNVFRGPRTAFGLGETGYKTEGCDSDDDQTRVDNAACQPGNASYITEYYTKLDRCVRKAFAQGDRADLRAVRYIGGYFYWWYLQDLVLSTKGGEKAAQDALNAAATTFGRADCP